jgi:hypothetical protein
MNRTRFIIGLLLVLFFLESASAQQLIPRGNYENRGTITYHQMAVDSNIVFWPLGKKGMLIFDVSDPNNLRRIKLYQDYEIRSYRKVYGSVNKVQVENNTAYLANGDLGFYVLDISNLINPVLKGRYYRHKPVCEFNIIDNYVILGLWGNGVEVVDMSSLKDIKMISRKNMTDVFVEDIELMESRVYVAAGGKGIRIISYKEPIEKFESAGFIRKFYPEGTAKEIIINGNIGFIANGKKEFLIIDLFLPEYPSVIKRVELEGKSNGLFLDNTRLYVATSKGIEVFSVENQENVIRTGFYNNDKRDYRKLLVEGDFLYASYKFGNLLKKTYGLQLFKIEE